MNSGRKRTVRTPEMLAELEETLEKENGARPQDPVTRSRSNKFNIKKTSFLRMMKEIKHIPFRVRRHQNLTGDSTLKRKLFCDVMQRKPKEFFSNLLVTDEKMFVVKVGQGHLLYLLARSSLIPCL